MYLNINIILIILAYQCLTICSLETDVPEKEKNISEKADEIHEEEHGNTLKHTTQEKMVQSVNNFYSKPFRGTRKGNGKVTRRYVKKPPVETPEFLQATVKGDCALKVPYEDYRMPIPINMNTPEPSVIYPNQSGYINIKQNEHIRVVCADTKFSYPLNFNKSELTIKCLGRDLLEFEGKTYKWEIFRCFFVPKPRAETTAKKCLSKYTIIRVGFKLNSTFLTTFNICFDLWAKNPLFAWYKVKTPFYEHRQISSYKPEFIKSPLYGDIDIEAFYRRQIAAVEKTIKSRMNTRKFIRRSNGEHYIAKGHLMSSTDFNYVFEQDATFFYENTSPMWKLFQDGIWADIERLVRRNLIKSSNTTHLIISGTYGLCTLPDKYKVQQPLILFPPKGLIVPLFYWKMDYDFKTQTGVVFLAMNDPYRTLTQSVYICETIPCPGKVIRTSRFKSVYFCCTKESFEKAYGRLDYNLFKETL